MPTPKSERLRLSEVREAFRIVGECRDLGADATAWRNHLASRVGGLVGSQVGLVGEALTPADGETPGDVLHATDHGWASAQAREIHSAYLASRE